MLRCFELLVLKVSLTGVDLYTDTDFQLIFVWMKSISKVKKLNNFDTHALYVQAKTQFKLKNSHPHEPAIL